MRGSRRMAICRKSSMLTADETVMWAGFYNGRDFSPARYTRAMRFTATIFALLTVTLTAAPSPEVLRVREWRVKNEGQILAELMQLLALPNVAANRADISRNADLLTTMFEKRGFAVTRWETKGSPIVFAR